MERIAGGRESGETSPLGSYLRHTLADYLWECPNE